MSLLEHVNALVSYNISKTIKKALAKENYKYWRLTSLILDTNKSFETFD
ncbi:MAG: hypothetical protein HRT67_11395 [Flavobacteriaceae bacterium]|nr:hypothetical protein [Flavobacteriaceae bacterium]